LIAHKEELQKMDSLGAWPDRDQRDAIISAAIPVATALHLLTSRVFPKARIRRRAISARAAGIDRGSTTRPRRNADYEDGVGK